MPLRLQRQMPSPYLDLIAVCERLVRLTDAQMLVEEDGLSIWATLARWTSTRQEDCRWWSSAGSRRVSDP